MQNGFLVEPTDSADIADRCLRLVTERALWDECSRNGLERITFYSWTNHCRYRTQLYS
jgi:glycosyltransferase involved in cell wall biosynthesis